MAFNKIAYVLFTVAVLQMFSITLSSAGPIDLRSEERGDKVDRDVDDADDVGEAWETSGYFEGDIVLPKGLYRNGRLSASGEPARWPSTTIPYTIDPRFDEEQKKVIEGAFDEYHNKTCIRFRPADVPKDVDYVAFKASPTGCSSQVGLRGGEQLISLQKNATETGCFRHGTVVHEILHTLGFYHQHSSTDRDDFLKIVWRNIKAGAEINFQKYSKKWSTAFGVEYDYNSILHYSMKAFSKNGRDTIVPKQPGVVIGQRKSLSPKDIQKLHLMYNCTVTSE